MRELDAVEAKQVEAILSRLPETHPAREACSKGLSLFDIAYCVDSKQPEVLRKLLDIAVQRHRRRSPSSSMSSRRRDH
jgi:hypothetical protein